MLKRKFTVVSQLHETNNQDIIHYFEEARFTYAKAVRQSFHIIITYTYHPLPCYSRIEQDMA